MAAGAVAPRGPAGYSGFVLDKSLEVEGTDDPTAGVTVIGPLAADQWARISGMTFRDRAVGIRLDATLAIGHCQGPVLLRGIRAGGSVFVTPTGDRSVPALRVDDASQVLAVDCRFENVPPCRCQAVDVTASCVTFQRCALTGGDGRHGDVFNLTTPGAPACTAWNSVLFAKQTAFHGGRGGTSIFINCIVPSGAGGDGIQTDGTVPLVHGSQATGGPGSPGFDGCPNGPSGVGVLAFGPAARVTSDCTITGGLFNGTIIPPLPWLSPPDPTGAPRFKAGPTRPPVLPPPSCRRLPSASGASSPRADEGSMRSRILLFVALSALACVTACRRARPPRPEGSWVLDHEKTVDAGVDAMRRADHLTADGQATARAQLMTLKMELDLSAGGKFTCRMGMGADVKTYTGTWKANGTDLRLDQTHEGEERVRDTMSGSVDGDVLNLLHDEPGVKMPYVLRRQTATSAAPPR